MYEIFGRSGPFGEILMPPEDIINQVRYPNEIVGYMRPDIEALKDNDLDYNTPDYVIGKIILCRLKMILSLNLLILFRSDERLLD